MNLKDFWDAQTEPADVLEAGNITAEKMIAALKHLEKQGIFPHHTNEALKRRVVLSYGPTLAVVRAGGYVWPMDENMISAHRNGGPMAWGSLMLYDYVEHQLNEQL